MARAPRLRHTDRLRHSDRLRQAGLALLACLATTSCTPLPVDVSVATSPNVRPRVIGVARDGVVAQVAVIDPPDVPAEHLPTLVDVPDGAVVEVVVMTLSTTLSELGLTLGLFEPGDARPMDPFVSALAGSTSSIERSTVEDGVQSSFTVVPAVPAWLGRFQLPALQPCTRLTAHGLPELPNPAMFIVALGDGRALVGVRLDADLGGLFVVRSDRTVRTVTIPRPADLVGRSGFFPTGALAVSGTPRDVWLSMRFGEMWRITLPEDGDETTMPAPTDRVPLGTETGLSFLHGRAGVGAPLIYGLDPAGPLVRFDGTTARTLYTFQDAGDYFGGGIATDARGVVFAVRNSEPNLVRVEGDTVTPILVEDAREGLPSVLFTEAQGLLFSDGRGRIFQRQDDGTITTLVDLDIGTGAQALIPFESGFLAAGGAGFIREWRAEGGACPRLDAAVTQTLRWWIPFGDAFLVSGPQRDGPPTAKTALTVFEPVRTR